MKKVLGTDGLMRDLDEHYISMNDVSEDPHGAWEAIQLLWEKKVDLEARNDKLVYAVAYATQKFTRQQARIAELEAALYKIANARTYDTIFEETEIWELEAIAREALKDTTNE